MRLDYSLRLNSAQTMFPRPWTPARLFQAGQGGAFFSAQAGLFQDTAGTQPVTAPGQSVALMWDLSNQGNHAVQVTPASRPTYGRHPARGIVNRANGSAAPANNAFWTNTLTQNGVTITRTATGSDAEGPWAEYSVVGTATALTSFNTLSGPSSRVAAAVGQVFTTSYRAWCVAGSEPPAGCGARADVWEEIAPTTVNGTPTISALFKGTTPTMLSATRTLSVAGTNQARAGFTIRVEIGATVNFTIRVQALQFEQGSARTGYQTNVSPFDITEMGQQDCFYIQPDGVDDWMQFSGPITLTYPFTLAAAHDLYPNGSIFNSTVGLIFGNSTTNDYRFFRGSSERLNVLLNGSVQRSVITEPVSGRAIDVARLPAQGGDGAYWRNGVQASSLAASQGDVSPLTFNALFRSGGFYSFGRFYGGAMIPRAVTDLQRTQLQRILAQFAGVSLP